MSSSYLNIRVGSIHFKLELGGDWQFSVGRNSYWSGFKWLKEPIDFCEHPWNKEET